MRITHNCAHSEHRRGSASSWSERFRRDTLTPLSNFFQGWMPLAGGIHPNLLAYDLVIMATVQMQQPDRSAGSLHPRVVVLGVQSARRGFKSSPVSLVGFGLVG